MMFLIFSIFEKVIDFSYQIVFTEVNMLINLIRYYFVFFYSLYISKQLTKQNYDSFVYKLYLYVFPLILAFLAHYIKLHKIELAYNIPLILLWFITSLFTLKPQFSYVIISISFGLSYGLFSLSAFISNLILYPIYYKTTPFPLIKLVLLIVVIQSLLIKILFNIKRFRKGMPFLASTTFHNIATGVSLFLLGLLMYVPNQSHNINIIILTPFLFILTLAILIHWWQAQITKSYKQALIQRELESLRTELAEKDRLLAQLTRQNEDLGRLIHHDNKRIPAMENAVCEYLTTDFTDSETAISKGNSLLLEIKELSLNRSNSVTQIYALTSKHHDTGISTLDTMLNFYEKRTTQEHISFAVNIAVDLHNFTPNTIEIDDFTHVLSDLLENAIIAVKQAEKPTVQLQFYVSQKYFVIEIADNGIPFETISLINYGITQLTTHADAGGSGIGLMDIWKIKEKYRASLHIAEYENNAPYTKKIALIFDKKHRYSISSYRKDELLQLSKRTDLQIF